MPIALATPKQTVTLNKAKIVAIKIEENPAIGQQWLEFWICLGRYAVADDPGTFVPYMDPETFAETIYIKLEDGHHPLSSSVGLGKCDVCETWAKGTPGGSCAEAECEGTVQPYDGWTRATSMIPPSGLSIRESLAYLCYQFLMLEEVPDSETMEMVKLLDGVME